MGGPDERGDAVEETGAAAGGLCGWDGAGAAARWLLCNAEGEREERERRERGESVSVCV